MIRIYAIIIGALLLLATSGGCYWFYNKWRDAEKQKTSLEKLNGRDFKTVEVYTNKNGNEVSKNTSLEFQPSTIKHLVKEGQLPAIKEFKDLKNSYNNLQNLIQSLIKIGNNNTIPITLDSTFGYTTEFENIQGSIHKDSSGYKLLLRDTVIVPLNIVVYWKRKWFLGKKSYSVEAESPNKGVKILGLESIQVSKK